MSIGTHIQVLHTGKGSKLCNLQNDKIFLGSQFPGIPTNKQREVKEQ